MIDGVSGWAYVSTVHAWQIVNSYRDLNKETGSVGTGRVALEGEQNFNVCG